MTNHQLYKLPKYYDIAFRKGFPNEVQIIERCFEAHVPYPVRDILDVGCGTGRLVLALAKRRYRVTGYDLQPEMVEYATARIREAGLEKFATVVRKDMRTARFRRKYHAAVSDGESFCYLLNDSEIIRHLHNTADSIKPAGIYLVGIVFAWDDPHSDDWDISWTERDNGISVTTTWDIEEQDVGKKISRQLCEMTVNDHGQVLAFNEEHKLRLWSLQDFSSLVRESVRFRLEAIYDTKGERVSLTSHISGEMGYHLYILKRLPDSG